MTRHDVNRLVGAVQGLHLLVAGEGWELYVFNISCADGEWFLHIALIGDPCHSVTVQLAPTESHVAARHLVQAIQRWLVGGDRSQHGFLDLAEEEVA
jgi:hypothetical protein